MSQAQAGGRVEVLEDHNFGLLKRPQGARDGTWRVEGKFPQERVKIEAPPRLALSRFARLWKS